MTPGSPRRPIPARRPPARRLAAPASLALLLLTLVIRGAAPIAAAAPAVATPPSTAAVAPAPALPAAGAKTAPAADHRQENKLLARRYLTEVLAAGRLDQLDQIVAKTFVDRSPAAPNARGLDAARQAAQRVRTVFATVEYDPQELTAEDDRVAVHYLVLGTPRPLPGKPAPPTVALDGVAFFHMHGGRIDSAFVLNDQAGFLRQLGFTMAPAAAPPAARGSAAAPSSPGATPPRGAPSPPSGATPLPGAAPPSPSVPPPAAAPPANPPPPAGGR